MQALTGIAQFEDWYHARQMKDWTKDQQQEHQQVRPEISTSQDTRVRQRQSC